MLVLLRNLQNETHRLLERRRNEAAAVEATRIATFESIVDGGAAVERLAPDSLDGVAEDCEQRDVRGTASSWWQTTK